VAYIFHNKRGKIRKNSRVGIFVEQHMGGIAGTNVGQYGQCGGVVVSIKA